MSMSDRRRRDDTVRAVDLFCGAGGLSWGLAQTCEHLDREVELALPKYWSELDPEDQSLYLHRNLSKDDLFEAIVREADLHEKDTTGSYPFKKHHLVDLLLELRARQ